MAASGQIPMYVKPKESEKITPAKRKEGLGIFSLFDDDDLIEVLEYLGVDELRTMSRLSRIFYMFASHEELWKSLCISRNVDQKTKTGKFSFKGTWRQTTLCPRAHKCKKSTLSLLNWQLSVTGYFSSFLYVKWFRANVPISAFAHCPAHIEKRSKLTMQQFIDEYESINKPVIITDALESWTSMSIWARENILKKYGQVLYKTNGTDSRGKTFKLTLEQYLQYAENNRDDKPVYLFDNKYFERAPDMLKEFSVPIYFKEDMFDYMTDEDRPDYRWILVGGPRSGSPLHQDPHRTSAWNALISGRKRWVLYPPDVIPPGVDEDLIDSEYYAAPDVMKWYLNYYPILKEHQKPMEIIQEPGETIFVPSGWWHQVLNLETSVAVTQNFCSSRNFNYVWKDMLERGGKALKRDFVTAVSKRHPELFEKYPQFEAQQKQQHSKETSSESDSDASSSDMSEDDT